MAPHSSTLAWKIPWMEESGRLQSIGSLRVEHNRVTSLFTFMHWRGKWQPTPVFLPGESQGQERLVGCRLWGRTESDTTEATQQQQQQHILDLNRYLLQLQCIFSSIELLIYKILLISFIERLPFIIAVNCNAIHCSFNAPPKNLLIIFVHSFFFICIVQMFIHMIKCYSFDPMTAKVKPYLFFKGKK